jgi:ATP-dependent Clp protease adaptor protein ClpS
MKILRMELFKMNTKRKEQSEVEILDALENQYELVLFNDEVNTFDFVIDSLISVCEHTDEQAHQCTLIVHYKGKCIVKTGELSDLKPRCSKLLELGLSAEVI